MLNFYLLSAAHDTVTDNDSSTACRSKFEAPSLKTITKKWKTFRKHGFHVITVWRFQTKKIKKSSLGMENKTPKAKTEHGPCNPEEKNWRKFEKIQIKIVGTLRD